MEEKIYNTKKAVDISIDFNALLKAIDNNQQTDNNSDLKPFYPK